MTRKLKFWNIPVTKQLDESVEKAIQTDSHVSKSDFVRDAVREKLAKTNPAHNRQGCIEKPY